MEEVNKSYLNNIDVYAVVAVDENDTCVGFCSGYRYWDIDTMAENDFNGNEWLVEMLLGKPARDPNKAPYGFIYDLTILPEYRNNGLGKDLASQVELWLKKYCQQLVVFANSIDNLCISGTIFQKLGFKIVGEIDEFWAAEDEECHVCNAKPCHCSAVILVK